MKLYWLTALLMISSAVNVTAQAPPAESGAFVLHKFAKAIGHEKYTLQMENGQAVLRDDFLFTDRGSKVPLTTVYTATGAGEPLSLSLVGKPARLLEINDALTLNAAAHQVHAVHDGAARDYAVSGPALLIDGYSPVSMQQQMMRFWLSHGRPAQIAAPPGGSIHIEPAGGMTVNGNVLHGYVVQGLIWGVETLWLDDKNRLIALVSTDAEFDHFEAVSDDYEAHLADFIRAAAQNSLDALGRLAARAKLPVARRLAITNVHLIDGTGAPELARATVFVQDGTIVRIASSPQPNGKPDVQGYDVLDGTGKWLMPGLWDMHAHYEQVEWGPIYLAAGATTVRDCGNEFDFITTVRDALAAGRGIGPRLLIAGLVDGSGPHSLGAVTADTPEEAVAVVRRYKSVGAVQIKIYSSMKPVLVPVITAEAHRLGMTVTGHVPDGMTSVDAIQAGMDSINHIQYPASDFMAVTKGKVLKTLDFSDPAIQQEIAVFKQHGTVMDDTLALFQLIFRPASVPVASLEPGVLKVAPPLREALTGGGVEPDRAARSQQIFALFAATMRTLHAAGVPFVAGTDQDIPGYSLHRELELYVENGWTPMEAIQAATSVPARFMGMSATLGTVEPGKRADLLLLDADPLADIHNTRRISRVIAGGAVYDPAPLWQSVGFTP